MNFDPNRERAPSNGITRALYALLLRDIRREADLTQEMIGERLRVSAWTIQMWEGARRVPRVTRLIEWCSVLGCRLALTPR